MMKANKYATEISYNFKHIRFSIYETRLTYWKPVLLSLLMALCKSFLPCRQSCLPPL